MDTDLKLKMKCLTLGFCKKYVSIIIHKSLHVKLQNQLINHNWLQCKPTQLHHLQGNSVTQRKKVWGLSLHPFLPGFIC